MPQESKLKGHDTIVYVTDENNQLLFIKTFATANCEAERLAAIDCFTHAYNSYGSATLTGQISSHVLFNKI